ncbi:hypothetical protein [Plantactinospora soyae]|uniref:Uncharacterized protein n=1 Tax=Plantactinospora soyae TaxID=1544732 RepID=A0A927M911_9ACTN|nr:hypothetical protein [Plantactinospora soyae]MBE1490398.1 hypothetical protein [Plantactinospora soyae]
MRFLGHFLTEDPLAMPWSAVEYVATQLEIAARWAGPPTATVGGPDGTGRPTAQVIAPWGGTSCPLG